MSHGTTENATTMLGFSKSLLQHMHALAEHFHDEGRETYPGRLPDEVCPSDRQLVLNDKWSSSHNLPVHQRSVLLQRPQVQSDTGFSKQCSGDYGALLTKSRLANFKRKGPLEQNAHTAYISTHVQTCATVLASLLERPQP